MSLGFLHIWEFALLVLLGRVLKNGCYKSFLTDRLLEVTNAETFGEDSLDFAETS